MDKINKNRICGLYRESEFPRIVLWVILIAAFALLYFNWLSADRELFRSESEYAVQAGEFSFSQPAVTAHHKPSPAGFPLFPALASAIYRSTGLSIETVLRGISLFMFGATALLCALAAARERRSTTAGFAAAAVYLCAVISIDKAAYGTPGSTCAFLLIAAQLAFFHYGIRKANWDAAWVASSCLISLAFLTGGWRVLIYFIFPMLFFRRPLSVRSKFRKPGFIMALAIICSIIFLWWVVSSLQPGRPDILAILDHWFYERDYFHEVLMFPLTLPIRLLPWTFIAWLPFCVALQAIDPTPIFSRYLRILGFGILLLLWFLPGHDTQEMLYLLGVLSIQCGMYYELGMRRYGQRIRRLLTPVELIAVLTLAAAAAVKFFPENWLKQLVSLSYGAAFREQTFFDIQLLALAILLIAVFFILHFFRNTMPVWMVLLIAATTFGTFNAAVIAPYRSQNRDKRQLGADITMALQNEKQVDKIYKTAIADLYGGLFYCGKNIYHLNRADDLPKDEDTVYLISSEFPQVANYNWTNLLPVGYRYLDYPISLWKGVRLPSSKLEY